MFPTRAPVMAAVATAPQCPQHFPPWQLQRWPVWQPQLAPLGQWQAPSEWQAQQLPVWQRQFLERARSPVIAAIPMEAEVASEMIGMDALGALTTMPPTRIPVMAAVATAPQCPQHCPPWQLHRWPVWQPQLAPLGQWQAPSVWQAQQLPEWQLQPVRLSSKGLATFSDEIAIKAKCTSSESSFEVTFRRARKKAPAAAKVLIAAQMPILLTADSWLVLIVNAGMVGFPETTWGAEVSCLGLRN